MNQPNLSAVTRSKQKITILGSTGSVGGNTLDVIERHPDRFDVFALTAATKWELMLVQCAKHRPAFAVMTDSQAASALAERLHAENIPTRVLTGARALCEVAEDERVDAVMAAIVGAAGLPPCMAAALAGKRLLLANKEALVVGGDVFMNAVRQGGAKLLPIDSEHSAIFQSLPDDPGTWAERIDKLILTASGGPFRTRDLGTFDHITPDQACAHPNWVMGRKISVDSATMMNKALEVIEARYLFGVDPAQIEVVIHPQSVIHSMVQYKDASVVAQLGTPDMRVPIAYGLSYPDRVVCGAASLNFLSLSALSFEAVDPARFPGLALAWGAMAQPCGPVILNAANEVAVQSFLDGRIRFDHIHVVNNELHLSLQAPAVDSIEALLDIDRQAREAAEFVCNRLADNPNYF